MATTKQLSKHTPGPLGYMGTEEFGFAVHQAGPGSPTTGRHILADNIRKEVDAKLYAKAPEMYELLERILRLDFVTDTNGRVTQRNIVAFAETLREEAHRIKAEIDGE